MWPSAKGCFAINLGNNLPIIKLVYQIFKPARYENHYTQNQHFQNHFLNQIDHSIDWQPIEQAIRRYYAQASDVVGRPAYPGLLLFKMDIF